MDLLEIDFHLISVLEFCEKIVIVEREGEEHQSAFPAVYTAITVVLKVDTIRNLP